MYLTVGNDDVCPPGDDRLNQVGDALLRVLVIAVGIDQDVATELQSALHAIMERAAQTAVAGMPDEVRHAVLLGNLDRAVGRTVIDDEDDDLVDPGDLFWDRIENQR